MSTKVSLITCYKFWHWKNTVLLSPKPQTPPKKVCLTLTLGFQFFNLDTRIRDDEIDYANLGATISLDGWDNAQ